MRKILSIVFLVMLFCTPAFAADKFAVVDINRVLAESAPAQNVSKQLAAQFKSLKLDLQQQEQEIVKMQQDMKNQNFALKLEARQNLEKELRRKVSDLQYSQRAYKQKFESEQQKLQKPMAESIREAGKSFAKKNGYSALIVSNGSNVLYADDNVDVTDAFIKEVNAIWAAKNK